MIRSFRSGETEKVFDRERSRKLAPAIQRVAQRRLAVLDAAGRLADLRIPPGNRLEKLAGERKGQYGICINNQWRTCFRWEDGDAYDVGIVDYHGG